MLKRLLILAVLALAVSVPAALADTGTPGGTQATQSSPASSSAGRKGGGHLAQRLLRLRGRIVRATSVFHARCESGKADPAKCTTVAQRLVTVLTKVDGRISTLIGKIQDRCNGATGQTVPKGCKHADQLVKRLGKLQTRVQTLEQKLQSWLANPPTGTGTASTSGSDGLAPLTTLGSALAGARNAANASGF